MIVSLLILLLGTACCVLFLLMLRQGQKYQFLVEPLTESDFPMKDFYPAGLALLDRFHYQYNGKLERRLRSEANILYGEKYVDYYVRITMAQAVSTALLAVTVMLSISGLANPSDRPLLAGVGLLLGVVFFYYYITVMKGKIAKQSKSYLQEFPNVVSKLALLVNAGMMLREAWAQVAQSGDKPLYQLMQRTCDDINNGQSDEDALFQFGLLSATPEIRKFTSVINQSISKGNADLAVMLAQQSAELWGEKKQKVLQQGELAAGKLVIPLGMIFVGVLILIIVPIMSNMAF